MIVFTTGYLGQRTTKPRDRKGEALVGMLDRLDAVLVDIRFMPWSKAPMWQKPELRAMVGGHRYWHIKQLGNVNHKCGGEIRIQNMDAGLDIVFDLAQTFAIVLLCGCESHEHCHRMTVAEELKLRGVGVFELHHWDSVVCDGITLTCRGVQL